MDVLDQSYCSKKALVRMPSGFAGSRTLDERRRRRLAQESNEVSAMPVSRPRHKDEPDNTAEEVKSTERPQRWNESVIPRSALVTVLFLFCGLILWSGILWLGQEPVLHDLGLGTSLGLAAGRTLTFFSTISLFLSAQFCFVIYWRRSRSRKDFSGRYRLWSWASAFWGLTCFASATGCHFPLAKIAFEQWPSECWRPETLYWLGPYGALFIATHRLLAREMRQCRTSRFLWNVTLLVASVAATLQLGLEMMIDASIRDFVIVAVSTAWQGLAAASLLIHARFVTHVTNEFDQSTPSRLQQAVGWTKTRASALKEYLRAEEESEEEGEAKAQPKKSATKSKPAEKKVAARASKSAEEKAPEKKADKPRHQLPRQQAEQTESKPKAKPQTQDQSASSSADSSNRKRVMGKKVRIDSADSAPSPHAKTAAAKATVNDVNEEEIDTSNLSKKERRRLRKLQRQKNR